VKKPPPSPPSDDRRFHDLVAVLLSVPEGAVVTYGDVARDAGHPRQSRLVGRVLSQWSDDLDLPWWRVVNATGRLVPGHEVEQARLLAAEGVACRDGRVVRGRRGGG
jgi:methylated-DNA-protein-cysteine methyltransferase-like protein